jgi:hypothetical protein
MRRVVSSLLEVEVERGERREEKGREGARVRRYTSLVGIFLPVAEARPARSFWKSDM